jgi:hypothetical protein
LKREQTSIASVHDYNPPIASFLAPLVSHFPLPSTFVFARDDKGEAMEMGREKEMGWEWKEGKRK